MARARARSGRACAEESDFAPLDGPPPLAATLGPEGVAEFLRKGAGLINQVEQSVLKRVADLSY